MTLPGMQPPPLQPPPCAFVCLMLLDRWDPLLGVIGTGLLPVLQHPLLSGLCQLAASLHAQLVEGELLASSYQGLVMMLLEVSFACPSSSVLFCCTHAPGGVPVSCTAARLRLAAFLHRATCAAMPSAGQCGACRSIANQSKLCCHPATLATSCSAPQCSSQL